MRALAMGVMTLMFVCSPRRSYFAPQKPRPPRPGSARQVPSLRQGYVPRVRALLGITYADGAYMAMSHGARDMCRAGFARRRAMILAVHGGGLWRCRGAHVVAQAVHGDRLVNPSSCSWPRSC